MKSSDSLEPIGVSSRFLIEVKAFQHPLVPKLVAPAKQFGGQIRVNQPLIAITVQALEKMDNCRYFVCPMRRTEKFAHRRYLVQYPGLELLPGGVSTLKHLRRVELRLKFEAELTLLLPPAVRR